MIAPAAMCAVKLPPNGIFSVNSVVMSPLITVTAVTVRASVAAQLQIACLD